MSFDIKCFNLAVDFLADEPKLLAIPEKVAELAQRIQDAIEDWINENRDTGHGSTQPK
jgi:hypothetical protein